MTRHDDRTLEIEGLTKRYGDLVAVDDLSLSAREGELLCLLGPSGCGKTTLLRLIAGLETPTAGRIEVDGEDVTGVPPYRRPSAMVFQDWALFPRKTVLENVAFGPKMAGVGRAERRERARELLDLVDMGAFADRRPDALSGGQQQRVALARALAVDPDMLLLDEPLSNLDRNLREEMQLELAALHDRLDKTAIYVTHDQEEAFTLADRIAIMLDGEIVQVGSPAEVYEEPATLFTEQFLGDTNLLSGRLDAREEPPVARTDAGLAVPCDAEAATDGEAVTVAIRPEALSVSPIEARADGDAPVAESRAEPDAPSVRATVADVLYRGATIRYGFAAGGERLVTERRLTERVGLEAGDEVRLSVSPADVRIFDARGEPL